MKIKKSLGVLYYFYVVAYGGWRSAESMERKLRRAGFHTRTKLQKDTVNYLKFISVTKDCGHSHETRSLAEMEAQKLCRQVWPKVVME